MGLLRTAAATLAVLGSVMAAPANEIAGRSAAAKVCDDKTKICFTEFVSTNGVSYRVAIPDSAAAGKPYDILVSLTAPKSIGWAGMAWGGSMSNNPLTVGWASGDKAVVSSRRATGHQMPAVDAATKYELLSGTANTTHWSLTALCTGCSSWAAGAKSVNLDPSTAAASFAWATSGTPPSTPADAASRFGIHNAKGKWTHDLAGAKNANFDALVKAAYATKARL